MGAGSCGLCVRGVWPVWPTPRHLPLSHLPPLSLPLVACVSFLPSKLTSCHLWNCSVFSWNLPRRQHLQFCFDFSSDTSVSPGEAQEQGVQGRDRGQHNR